MKEFPKKKVPMKKSQTTKEKNRNENSCNKKVGIEKKLTGRPWQAQAAPETPPASAAYTASGGGFNDVLNRWLIYSINSSFILYNLLIYFFILFPYFDTHIIEAYTDIAWGGGFNDDL